MKIHNLRENTFRYLTEKEVQREFFLYKIRIARQQIERNRETLEEYRQNYFWENSPFDQHDFRPHQPFVGCFKRVCRFCLAESSSDNFTQSVHAHKGKRFGSEKKKGK